MFGEPLVASAPTFVLVFCRVAGLALAAPLLRAAAVPRVLMLMGALVLAAALTPGVAPVHRLPASAWALGGALGAELVVGLLLGLGLGVAFYAVDSAGQLIGQQLGLNLSQTLDPGHDGQGSCVGDLYFLLAVTVFLMANGHHAVIRGLHDSFRALPPLTVGLNRSLLDAFTGLLQSSMALALQLAAPVLLTLLVVELALGLVSRTMPQWGMMWALLPLRSAVGLAVMILGLSLTSRTIAGALQQSVAGVMSAFTPSGV